MNEEKDVTSTRLEPLVGPGSEKTRPTPVCISTDEGMKRKVRIMELIDQNVKFWVDRYRHMNPDANSITGWKSPDKNRRGDPIWMTFGCDSADGCIRCDIGGEKDWKHFTVRTQGVPYEEHDSYVMTEEEASFFLDYVIARFRLMLC